MSYGESYSKVNFLQIAYFSQILYNIYLCDKLLYWWEKNMLEKSFEDIEYEATAVLAGGLIKGQ